MNNNLKSLFGFYALAMVAFVIVGVWDKSPVCLAIAATLFVVIIPTAILDDRVP